jgi:2-keto-3-deoxy-L-rhamnonate aldolase RhmA
MPIFENHTLNKLMAGQVVLGMGVRQSRTADLPVIAQEAGFDWLFIDMEHSTIGVQGATDLSLAALGLEVTALVRVPGHQHFHATRVLDGGAMGVVVPDVATVEQAEAVARNCKFPPVGRRSVPGTLPQVGFAKMPVGEITALINRNTLVVVMVESEEGIENAEAIAAVQGVDAVLIGTNDLAARLGIPGQFDHPRIEAAYACVIAAAKAHGKFPGMGGVYEEDLLGKYIGMGMRLILAGSDLAFMLSAGRQRTAALRALPPVP